MAGSSSSVPFNLQGKTAIVTGAGSGINLCFADLLLSKGCNVVFADLSLRPEAQKVVGEHSAKSTGKARAIFQQTDVTDWKQLRALFSVASREFGDVDIVCPAKSKDSQDSGHYATLDININHPIRTTQLAVAYFLNHKGKASPANPKRIVHISSIAGETASFATPLYHASKWAIMGFVRSLEWLEQLGIRVNVVAPGVIKTPLWTDHPEKQMMVDESKDEWATPEEVAEAMLRLVVDDECPGGTVLEVGHKQTRKVPLFNNPGPSGTGNTVSGIGKAFEEVYGWLGQEGWGKDSLCEEVSEVRPVL
ncbi:hypothetical protein H2203_004008 [Taxawa tesnikishii (nom. ined.)]|nr:hypothetical protein H2203_004008 [Dothideales sp. JES 119]